MTLYEANAELVPCIAHGAPLAFYEMIWFPTSMRYEMSNVPWSLVSVSVLTMMVQSRTYEPTPLSVQRPGKVVLQHEIGTYQTVFETRSLQQVRDVRDPPVFMTKAHIYYGLCEYPGDRHCEVGKMEGGLRSSRARGMAETSKVI